MSSTRTRRIRKGFRYSTFIHRTGELIDTDQMDCAICGLALADRGRSPTATVAEGPFYFGAHINCKKHKKVQS